MVEFRERLSPEEREHRRRILLAVGPRVYGGTWQPPLAEALSTHGRPVPRQRLVHWTLPAEAPNSKPVPYWALSALLEIARHGVVRLRADAAILEEIVAGEEPPAPTGGTPPAAEAAPDTAPASPPEDEADPLALVSAMIDEWFPPGPDADSDFPRYEPPAPPPPRDGWRSRFAESHGYR